MKAIIIYFQLLWGKLRFRIMCHKAELLHDSTGKRYFVIPRGDGKLMVINSDERKRMQHLGIMNKSIDHLWLMRNCLYYTNQDGKNNDTRMSKQTARQKEELYLKHLEKSNSKTDLLWHRRLNKRN